METVNKTMTNPTIKAQEIEKEIGYAKHGIKETKKAIKEMRAEFGGHTHQIGRTQMLLKKQKEQLLTLERSHPDRAKQIAASENL